MKGYSNSIAWMGATVLGFAVAGCSTMREPDFTATGTIGRSARPQEAHAEVRRDQHAALMPHNLAKVPRIHYKATRPAVQPTTNGSLVSATIPAFHSTWPPASPTTFYPYERETFKDAKTYGDVAKALLKTLAASGRYQVVFYSCPGGFALVVHPEQIDALGHLSDKPVQSFLLAKDVYKSRMFVWFFSNQISQDPDKKLTFEHAAGWMQSGGLSLDQQTAKTLLTSKHQLFAFVYIFQGPRGDQQLLSKDLSAEAHLSAANIDFPQQIARTAKPKSGKQSGQGDSPK